MASTSTFELMQQSLDSFTAQVVKSESLGFRSRLALQNVSQKLNLALETPGDTFQQVAWLPLQTMAVSIGIYLDLFENLEKAGPDGKTISVLEKDTGASPILQSLNISF
ncbi:hypothetical protein MMC20_005625 [Loxospora ochrophaea]|nr:hypothetical protein [Loxospora ochrophaea]